jgi:hypothetical protein
MEPVRNGEDWTSAIAILTADIGRLDQRVGKSETRLGAVEIRLGAVEIRLGAVEMRLGAVETRLGELGERVARVETGIDFLRSDIKSLGDRHTTDFRLMFGALVTVALGLSSLMAKGFGWL